VCAARPNILTRSPLVKLPGSDPTFVVHMLLQPASDFRESRDILLCCSVHLALPYLRHEAKGPMTTITIEDAGKYDGQEVTLQGWLYNIRESGKLVFPIFRDGTGVVQGVAAMKESPHPGI
jgi:hypothetical protein